MRNGRRRWGCLLLVVVLLAIVVFWGIHVMGHARALMGQVDRLQALAQEKPRQVDPDVAVALLNDMHANLSALQTETGPVLWLAPYLGWVPRYGADIQAAPVLLATGIDLTGAGQILAADFAPLLQAPPDDAIPDGVQALQDAGPDMHTVRAQLQSASQSRAQLDSGRLSPRLQRLVDRLDHYLPLAKTAVDAAIIAPRLLGAQTERTYLILAQNDDERRATGGYITGVGEVHLEHGRIGNVAFMDSYAVDDFSKPYPDPPRPLLDYMLSELWLFRDSNWSPDFPTAAQKAAYFYEYGKGKKAYGVIAIDMKALQLLVKALQPVTVPGASEPITGDNVIEWLRQSRGGNAQHDTFRVWWKQRKSFMGPLALALQKRLEKGNIDWSTLAQAVEQALQEKHILVYVEDPDVAAFLSGQGWNGAVKSPDGDFLLVVDSNVGFNKVNGMVDETIRYEVTLQEDGSADGTLDIVYHNRSRGSLSDCNPGARYGVDYDADINRCYWDYLRVYVPEGSQLLSATPAPLPEISLHNRKKGGAGQETLTVGPPDLGKQVFAVYQLVPRGGTREQRFAYALPQETVHRVGGDWLYDLTVQKQAGAPALPLTVTVVLPAGGRVVEVNPRPASRQGQNLVYRWRLDRDRTLQIRYR